MNTLIVYAGRNGTSTHMANRIAAQVGENAEVLNLKKQTLPSLEEYQQVIIGGSILAGSVPKALKKFIEENTELLLTKKVGLFLCCLIEKEVDKYFRDNFPEPLYSHAEEKRWLGGELIMSDHNFMVRKMLNKIIGSSEDIHNLRWDEADKLAAGMNGS